MRETFDDELSDRLFHYKEEPRATLWDGIASAIQVSGSEPLWISWSAFLSWTMVLLSALLLVISEPIPHGLVQSSSLLGLRREALPEIARSTALSSRPVNTVSKGRIRNVPLGNVEMTMSSEKPSPVTTSLSLNSFPTDDSSKGEHAGETVTSAREYHSTDTLISEKLVAVDTIAGDRERFDKRKSGKRVLPLSIYVMAMPLLGYATLEPNLGDNAVIESVEGSPVFSADRLGFRAELGVEFPLSKRVVASGGLVYFQGTQTIHYLEKVLDSLTYSASTSGPVFLTPQWGHVSKSFEYELKNLGIRFGLLYKLSSDKPVTLSTKEALSSVSMLPKRKFLHFVGGGIEVQRALRGQDGNGEALTWPSLYLVGNLYYRLQYPDKGRMRMIFQPMFNYALWMEKTSQSPVVLRPFSFGFNVGITYAIR